MCFCFHESVVRIPGWNSTSYGRTVAGPLPLELVLFLLMLYRCMHNSLASP